jgi:hypothetical protein
MKNDRERYCHFAEEMVMFGAQSLEEIFNGENVWFGRYTPDLTGWHNTVSVKMRRMRHDTSTIVSGAMNNFHIGPAARVLLELVPSMFMHSGLRKKQSSNARLYSQSSIASSMNSLRDIGSE